ncbi:MAG: DNA polymerase III subunit alpha [Acholeplasma sp.]|nr:DNA polymerase III subunit alpha [Acholeplasma sp.]
MKGVLYLQSSYTMLGSLMPLQDLITYAKKANYEFIALSDDKLHGAYELFKVAKDNNIKPILGLKLKVMEPYKTVFLIYVKNLTGYHNLLKISSLQAQNHHFTMHDLVKYQKGIIFVTAGYESIIDNTILYGNKDVVIDYLRNYKNNFDSFYVGLSFNYESQRINVSDYLFNLCFKENIKVLPVHKSNYFKEDDKFVYEALIRISNDKNEVSEQATFKFLTVKEIEKMYKGYEKVFDYLDEFVRSINFELKFPKFEMPIYQNKNKVPNDKYLQSLARLGLKRRLETNTINDVEKKYQKRLDYELEVINSMNFANYFLIVYDFVKYAKDNDILVGPGRGSAAGSLVAYCLGITNVDPIKYDLMFERFLNPARMSMPDIDMDFPDNRRNEVIDYVKNKYGENHICSISTFSSLAVKSAIRDIARVLKIDNARVSGIVQAVINDKIDETDNDIMRVKETAKKIEGLYRQTGTHAAGIILSEQDLTAWIPMQSGAYDFNQSQFEADVLEKIGLHKIDFLGIRNLTIIDDIIKKLNKKGIKIDLNNIPFNDKKTFSLLSKGDTTGLFQLESAGMRRVLIKLKPNSFEDIVATLALYRPGPMENIDIYIERRNGKTFSYLHNDLISILKSTYGIIVYQEQVMQIAVAFAGYSLFDADMLRVGISKKNFDILKNEEKKFIDGALKKGYDKALAKTIYDYIVKFGDYGFNRSHSVSYGIVAYQMAYLKAHYYNEFMSALLSSVIGNEGQTKLYIEEVIANGVKVYNPNINYSSIIYKENENGLLMPLNAIKGIGNKTALEILNEQEKGKFSDYNDVKSRLKKIVSSSQFVNLINSGCFDQFGLNRRTLTANSDLDNVGMDKYIKDFKILEVDDYSFKENQSLETSALGLNLKYLGIGNVSLPKGHYKVSDLPSSLTHAKVVGFVDGYREIKTKNDQVMAFIVVSDGIANLEITVFNNLINEVNVLLKEDLIVFSVQRNVYKEKVGYILSDILKYKKD